MALRLRSAHAARFLRFVRLTRTRTAVHGVFLHHHRVCCVDSNTSGPRKLPEARKVEMKEKRRAACGGTLRNHVGKAHMDFSPPGDFACNTTEKRHYINHRRRRGSNHGCNRLNSLRCDCDLKAQGDENDV